MYFDNMVSVKFYLIMPRLLIIFSFLLFSILAWSQAGNSNGRRQINLVDAGLGASFALNSSPCGPRRFRSKFTGKCHRVFLWRENSNRWQESAIRHKIKSDFQVSNNRVNFGH